MKFPQDILNACWFLAGPTACGKTVTGIALAERIGAEIVSLDAMAVYRGMDIGTAKPDEQQRSRVPHHLIDVAEPHDEFTTAEYLRQSVAACRGILDRGRVPLFVGGTGLYLRSVLRGVFSGPPADWQFRNELASEARQFGAARLHQRLKDVDPATADRLHPHDQRRVIRALEIFQATGQAPSTLQDERPLLLGQRPRHIYWLSPPRDWLYERINQRVQQMLQHGLIDEVRLLLARPLGLGHTARQGLGYKEVIEFLDGRIASEGELLSTIQTRTRQFAKRQLTWFRNLEECQEVAMRGTESAQELAARMLSMD